MKLLIAKQIARAEPTPNYIERKLKIEGAKRRPIFGSFLKTFLITCTFFGASLANPLENNWAHAYKKAAVCSVKIWKKSEQEKENWYLESQQHLSENGQVVLYKSFDPEGKIIFKEKTKYNAKGEPQSSQSNFSKDIYYESLRDKNGFLILQKKFKDKKLVDSSMFKYSENRLSEIKSWVDGVWYKSLYQWNSGPLFPDVSNYLNGENIGKSKWHWLDKPKKLEKKNLTEQDQLTDTELWELNKWGLPAYVIKKEQGIITEEWKYEYGLCQ